MLLLSSEKMLWWLKKICQHKEPSFALANCLVNVCVSRNYMQLTNHII